MIINKDDFDINKALEVFSLVNKIRKPDDIKETYNLIYLIQRKFLKDYHNFIFYDNFKCSDYSIKPIFLDEAIKESFSKNILDRPHPEYLSVADISTIKNVLKEYSFTDRYKLWDIVSNLPEVSIYSDSNISGKDILEGLGYLKEEINIIISGIEDEKEVSSIFNKII